MNIKQVKTAFVGMTVGFTSALGLTYFQNAEQIEPVGSSPRSPHWATVRAIHLKNHPECAACGQTDNVNVHHIRPFHLSPELELEPSNLITLCTDGPGHLNCHLLCGHGGNWSCTGDVRENIKRIRDILNSKVCKPRD